MKSPVKLLCSFLDSVERLHPSSVQGLDRDKLTIERRFKHEGFGFLSITLPSLCDALDHAFAAGRFTCPTSFKRRGALPRLFSGLLCKVFDTDTGLLLTDFDVSYVKLLREILRFYKKTVTLTSRTAMLDREAKDQFFDVESEIPDSFPKSRESILRVVSKYVLPNLDCVSVEHLLYGNGPGSVAETSYRNRKWIVIHKSLLSQPTLARLFGLDWIFSDEYPQVTLPVEGISMSEMLFESDLANGVVPLCPRSTCAKLVSVAKNSTSRRTITVEPAVNMYLQQGLNRYLRDSISQCSILSRCLALTDQAKNQHLAEVGSRTGEYATIDLSAASDRLAHKLVDLCFWKAPKFRTLAYACRTSHVRHHRFGVDVPLKKFAGMGNALTFPIQSVVFALLAMAAMAEQDGVIPSYTRCKRYATNIQVYGDDIIVPSEYYATVASWLASFGLKVNLGKSFSKGNFRESCGADWVSGIDVSPVYLRLWPDGSALAADEAASLVSTANQLWLRCLYEPAVYLQRLIENALGRLPLVSKDSSLLGWVSRIDAQHAHVWDADRQSLMTKGYCVSTRKRTDVVDDVPALFGSLSELNRREGYRELSFFSNSYSTSILRFRTRLRRRRMPTYVGNPTG